MKKLMTLLIVLVFSSITWGQTVLISPTGDGGFETGLTPAANNWTAVNSTTDGWYVGAVPVVSAGVNCGYISSTAGVDWTYSQTSVIQHLYYDVTIPAGESKLTLTFKWKAEGEGTTTSDYDNMKVFFGLSSAIGVPVTNTAVSSTYKVSGAGAVNGMYKLNSTTWNSETIAITGTPGSTYRLVFSWKSDGSDIYNPPAAIDEVSLTSVAPDPLHGVYTIDNTVLTTVPMVHDGTGIFASFTDAINFLNSEGISAAVTFNVLTGLTFTEDCPAITATGTSTNTITFTRWGSGANPIISATGTTGSYDAGIIIKGGDYLTFNGIDIAIATGSDLEYGYLIQNASVTDGAQNNIIANSKITLNRSNTASKGIYLYREFTASAATGANSNNTIHKNTIENSYMGIYVYGTSAWPDIACIIDSNMVGAASANDIGAGSSTTNGIRASYQSGITIAWNTVRNVSSSTTTYGIYLENGQGTNNIFANNVYSVGTISTGTSVVYGIRTDINSGYTVNVYNNMVSDLYHGRTTATSTQVIRGITIGYSGTGTGNIVYNSVLISEDEFPSSTAMYVGGGTVNLANNIFANTSEGGATSKRYSIYRYAGTLVSNYNDLYVAAGTNNFLGYYTADQLDLPAWQAASSQDANSIVADPTFLSNTDLHTSSPLLDGKGTPVAEITADIDGDIRNVTTPDIGADEFTPPSCGQPTALTASNQTYISADISWTAPILCTPVSYEWEVRTSGTGGSGPVGLVSNGITDAPSVTASISVLSGGTLYTFYVRTYCGGVDFSPWSSNTFSTLSCDVPTGITATSITAATADINWVAPLVGSPSGYEWEVRSSGAAGSGATGLAASGSTSAPTITANASGLAAQTTYSIYVRTLCYTGFYSSWTSAVTFTTLCIPFSLDVVEGFNTASLPSCWSIQWVTSTGEKISFVESSSNQNALPQEGTNFVRFNSYSSLSGGAGAEERLITPQIITTGTPSVDVEFYWFESGNSTYTDVAEGVQLEWSSDGSTWNNSTFFPRYVATASTSGEWVKKTVTLPAGAGNIPTLSVSFKFHSEYDYNCYLDNVTIKPTPDCLVPTGVTASVTPTSAIINWTASTSNPTGGYDIYYSTSSTAPDAATTPTASVAAGVTTYPTGNTLTPNTLYYLWVRSNCGSSYSSWASVITFLTGYCVPAPTSVDGIGITNVTFSTVNNTTGEEVNNYGDYSAMIGNVTQGVTVPVNITYETGYEYDTKIWIDWNDDLDFADAGEEVYTGTSLNDDPTTLAASFVVPGTAPLGNHRMRIGGQDNTPVIPCYTGSYGTFEDYTVNVVAPVLPVITSLGATSGCVGSSLTITGTDLAGATSVTIGGTAATITANTATDITVTIGTGTTGTVSVTTLGGTATSTETFTVNQLPSVFTVSGGGAYCAGATGVTITLDGSVSGVNYELSTTPVTTLAGTGSPLTFGPSAFEAGTYTVTAVDPITTCSIIMTGNANVIVNPSPSAVTASASSNTICEGNSIDLFSSAISNIYDSVNYTEGFETWPPTGWTFINAGSGDEWSSYSYTYHSGSYCMAYSYNSDYSANTWGITGPVSLDAGTAYSITFWYKVEDSFYPEKLQVTVGNAATVVAQSEVLWDNNGGSDLTNEDWAQAIVSYTPSTSGTYYFGFNCYSDEDEDILFVDDLSITGTPMIPPSYSWTSNPAGFTSTDQNPVGVIPPAAGSIDYIVTASNSLGCSNTATTTVVVDPCTGIENNDGINVSIVPNPSNGMFYLNVEGITETVTMNIYSIDGKVIYAEQVDNTGLINKPIDLKSYPKGMYFLRLINNNMTHTEKIIIE